MQWALIARMIGTATRQILSPVIIWLSEKGYITADDGTQLLIDLGAVLAMIGWGGWSRHSDWIMTKLALRMPPDTTVKQLETIHKTGKTDPGISNLSLILVGLLAVSSLGFGSCGAKTQKDVERAVRDVYIGLQAASEGVEALYDAKKLSKESALQAYSSLNKVGLGTKQLKETVRQLGAIGPDNKNAILAKIDVLVAQVDEARHNDLLNLSEGDVKAIQLNYELIKTGYLSLKAVIQKIKKPVPVSELPALAQVWISPDLYMDGVALDLAYDAAVNRIEARTNVLLVANSNGGK